MRVRSTTALASLGSENTLVHSPNGRLVVTISDPRVEIGAHHGLGANPQRVYTRSLGRARADDSKRAWVVCPFGVDFRAGTDDPALDAKDCPLGHAIRAVCKLCGRRERAVAMIARTRLRHAMVKDPKLAALFGILESRGTREVVAGGHLPSALSGGWRTALDGGRAGGCEYARVPFAQTAHPLKINRRLPSRRRAGATRVCPSPSSEDTRPPTTIKGQPLAGRLPSIAGGPQRT